jgi:hypothetical protein
MSDRTALEPSRLLEREFEEGRALLCGLEAELAEREAELAAFLDALATFERRYHDVLGPRYGRLADLSGELADLRDTHAREAPAAGTATGAGEATAGPKGHGRPAPTESARRLFRRLARRIHPDLARSAEERQRRTLLMMAANQAWAAGDVERLAELLAEWELGPDAVAGSGPEADLERLVRRVEQVRRRLASIAGELEAAKASHMGAMHLQAAQAAGYGFDLLADMAAELDKVIERTEADLRALEPAS